MMVIAVRKDVPIPDRAGTAFSAVRSSASFRQSNTPTASVTERDSR